jgi:hypothetical protein
LITVEGIVERILDIVTVLDFVLVFTEICRTKERTN